MEKSFHVKKNKFAYRRTAEVVCGEIDCHVQAKLARIISGLY
jgi:hypothetical protein